MAMTWKSTSLPRSSPSTKFQGLACSSLISLYPRCSRKAEPRNMLFFNGDVQILMSARLPAEERVDTPSAVDPNQDAHVFEFSVEADDAGCGHGSFLARHKNSVAPAVTRAWRTGGVARRARYRRACRR